METEAKYTTTASKYKANANARMKNALKKLEEIESAATLKNTTWCNDCGTSMEEGQEECEAYSMLRLRRDYLRAALRITGLLLKVKGPNILVQDKERHEIHL